MFVCEGVLYTYTDEKPSGHRESQISYFRLKCYECL